tara:strand:+ start:1402 stop:1620 length:219 start_codon:yes stop_codon:yes gene_type:complete
MGNGRSNVIIIKGSEPINKAELVKTKAALQKISNEELALMIIKDLKIDIECLKKELQESKILINKLQKKESV